MRKDSISQKAIEQAYLMFSENGFDYAHPSTDYLRGTAQEPEMVGKLSRDFDELAPANVRDGGEFERVEEKIEALNLEIDTLQSQMRVSRQRGAFQQLQAQMKKLKNLIKEKEALDAKLSVLDLGGAQTTAYDRTMEQESSYAENLEDVSLQIEVLEELLSDFFSYSEVYDFARCKRPDGSFYGTKGKCRKGVNAGPAVAKAVGKPSMDVGVRSLWDGVMEHAGRKGVKQLDVIRRALAQELGVKNIVKGERAKELKKRLQEANLLPSKAPSGAPAPSQKQASAKAPAEPKQRKKVSPSEKERRNQVKELKAALGGRTPNDLDKLKRMAQIRKDAAEDGIVYAYDNIRKKPELEEAYKKRIEENKAELRKINKAMGLPEDDGIPGEATLAKSLPGITRRMRRGLPTEQAKIAAEEQRQNMRDIKAKREEQERKDKEGEAPAGGFLKDEDFQPPRSRGIRSKIESLLDPKREEARQFDDDFIMEREIHGEDPGYDFERSWGKGSKSLGEGAYGSVRKDPGPPPVAVKRGQVSEDEALIIDTVGRAGLGPRLIHGELGPEWNFERREGVSVGEGRIAMSIVPGSQIMGKKYPAKAADGEPIADKVWKARAELHRLGIAHNDMHPGNVFYDPDTNKVRFVDFGLAQNNAKAALAEALGAVKPRVDGRVPVGEGDWQISRWREFTGTKDQVPETLQQMRFNANNVVKRMDELGFSPEQIRGFFGNGIRNNESDYDNPPWNRISEQEAKNLIDLLYEGI